MANTNLKTDFMAAIFGKPSGATIEVKFLGHDDTDTFSREMLPMLRTDSAFEWAIDSETGELLD